MPKRKCKFTNELERRYPSFAQGNSLSEVLCRICNSTLSIANKGARDIEDHLTTEKHKRNVRNLVNKTSQNSLLLKSDSETKSVVAAEGTLAFHTVRHHPSYNSGIANVHHIDLNDCGISEVTTSTTKLEAIVNSVLGPHSVLKTLIDLQEISYVGVSVSNSNYNGVKLLSICLQYFDFKNGGIQTKLIDMKTIPDGHSENTEIKPFLAEQSERFCKKAIPNEQSSVIANNIIDVLNQKGILSKCVAFSDDYYNTNFGGHSRIMDVYSRLKLAIRDTLIGVGCPATVLNNTIHYGTDTQPFDIESIVLKIYNYFSTYAVRTESTKGFCNFVEKEYQKLLCHTKARWLSLFPAIDHILKFFEPLKVYFLTQENTPEMLQKFFQSDFSECYMLVVHSLMSVFYTNIQTFEKNDNSLIEIIEVLKLVHTILKERLNSEFVPQKIYEILKTYRENGLKQEADEFTNNMQLLYDSCIEYLESWLEQFEEFSCFQWMNLKETLVWKDVLPSLIYLQEKGIAVDNTKFFDQWSCLKVHVEKQLKDELFNSHILAHEAWSRYFIHCKRREMCSELLKLAEFVFAIPSHDAGIQKLSSIILNHFAKEKHVNTIESIKGIIMVQYNFQNMSCYTFHNYLQLNPKLLDEITKL